jgi:integrase
MSLTRTKHPGVYRRGAKYVAVVTYREVSGRARQKWLTARTIRRALDARRRFLNDLDRGVRPDGGKMTVGEYLSDLWLPEIAATRRPLTVEKYRSVIARHILPSIGGVRLRDLGRDQLRDLYRSLPSVALARFVHSVLSSALSYAVKDLGLLAANPCATIRPPREQRQEARYLEPDEARAMLAAAKGDRLEGAIVLGLAGGLRRAEVCGLQWGDVDLDGGTVMVRGSYWGPTKSGRVRRLALPASPVAALRRYKAHQAADLLRLGIQQERQTPFMATFDGRVMAPHTLGKMFRAFCDREGFEGLTFHALRHTNASLILASGTDVKTAATRLGHANPSLLFDTYAHFISAADQEAADRLGRALG